MAEPLVSLCNIRKEFAGVVALDDVSVTINKGQVCCLAGENGSGKSTLIKVLSGMYRPEHGTIEVDGHVYESFTPADAIRSGFQFIYQDFSLLPNLSVAENIAFGELVASGGFLYSVQRARTIAQRALSRINFHVDVDAPAGELTLAERQLVAIAAALAKDARLIVMDEATTALSRKEVEQLLAIIEDLRSQGVSTLFVSHKLDEVVSISDHTIVLRNGTKVADRPAEGMNRAELINAMTGKDVAMNHVSEPISADAPIALEVSHVSRPHCFSDVSFQLHEGEILGVTGLLGSGRDTLALALFGLLPITEGTISIYGERVSIRNPRDAMKHGIGYVPADRLTEGLFLDHSIASNVAIRTIKQIRNAIGLVTRGAIVRTGQDWVDRLHIKTPNVANPVSGLSGGNQQRVVLAKWLSGKPRILILNGPTVGVDIKSKSEILDQLREFAADGMAVIVISDDIPELLDVSNRIMLMRSGSIAAIRERKDITESNLNELLVEQ
ncbi:sugar ABC transporter ATP-binding protein [Bifidobacterium cebidarum]|uniref:Lipase n=1 Tax=Bifidobacterium cebidarum TaxID=2650773 RepID=A0A6I1G986_9BIFI|nr:sugar ABC transporter ATP-binding protein [Bifidobacterium cebidarum]KAB7788115.1 lipase [Bifidobacterium cebidarum]